MPDPQQPSAVPPQRERPAPLPLPADLLAERAATRARLASSQERTQRTQLRRQAVDKVLLLSPSGGVFEVTVTDDGQLAAKQTVPVELTPRDGSEPELVTTPAGEVFGQAELHPDTLQ